MTLAEHVEHYVTFRRALGHAYVEQARCLQDYATHAEACGDSFVRSSTVLDWASTQPGTVTGTRDRAMLCLTYNAGLRVSELVGLALDDLKMPTLDEVHIIGKGRRERILPLWKETRRAPA